MIYRTIQGTTIPALGLGTWQLAGDACTESVEHALDLGYRHLDTAQAYGNEREVGQGLRNAPVDRDDVFLTTKVWFDNLAPRALRSHTEDSLRRLDTEYVDLLLIHWPSDDVPLERSLDAMMELRNEGKVREIGVSNFTPSLVRRALDHAPILCNQVEYHPFLDQDALLELAEARDLLLTAYSPLAKNRVSDDATLRAIAEAHGKTPPQVTLRWLLQQDPVAAIPKAASAEHRAANLDVFDFELSEEEMDRIFDLAGDERIIDPSFAPAW